MTIFLTFHNGFMMLVHMEVYSKYHLLMVDSIQIRSGVPKCGRSFKVKRKDLKIAEAKESVISQCIKKHQC